MRSLADGASRSNRSFEDHSYYASFLIGLKRNDLKNYRMLTVIRLNFSLTALCGKYVTVYRLLNVVMDDKKNLKLCLSTGEMVLIEVCVARRVFLELAWNWMKKECEKRAGFWERVACSFGTKISREEEDANLI